MTATQTDYSHLDALLGRLTREIGRREEAETILNNNPGKRAKTKAENEVAFRTREIESCKKEIDAEYRHLGIDPNMSDDDLLSELLA
jgi:hypothetical protein